MKRLTWLVGPPGSGKSTWVNSPRPHRRVVELNELFAPLVTPVRMRKGILRANGALVRLVRDLELHPENRGLPPLLVAGGLVPEDALFPLGEDESSARVAPERNLQRGCTRTSTQAERQRARSLRPATKMAAKSTRESHSSKEPRRPPDRRWSRRVTETSNALDLEPGVFRKPSPRAIAESLKRSADQSDRRKADPFRSALSMLTFYINRAGRSLDPTRRSTLEAAKDELRVLYGRPPRDTLASAANRSPTVKRSRAPRRRADGARPRGVTRAAASR